MPESAPLYPGGELTDEPERTLVGELVALANVDPHLVALLRVDTGQLEEIGVAVIVGGVEEVGARAGP
ncbi:MAG: hypothetical protein ACRDSL_14170 [Pseudonocardiaceae bacterium]